MLAFTGAVLSAVGLMHAPELSFLYNPSFTIGYLAIALVFVYFHHTNSEEKLEDNQMATD
jgi:AGZA family xanthine/uracil permease-like MFS transporter